MIITMPHCGVARDSTSGGEVVERELLPRLPPQGIEPHVLLAAHLETDGLVAERFRWRGLRWWNAPVAFWPALRRCIGRHRPRLLHAHSLRYAGPVSLWAGRVWGLPVTAHFHHLDADTLAWLDRWVLRRATHVTTDSEFSAAQARALGVSAHVVRLGVDHGRFRPAPLTASRIVLCVGGTKPRKNTAFLHALWPEVKQRVPAATLLVAGQGCAPITDLDLAALYRACRVMVFPSRLEGFGLPVLEAMATARPVVCSDQGALPELGARTTLPLVPSLWVDQLVAYLTDDALWRRAAEANYARSIEYSWEQTAADRARIWRMIPC